MPLSPSRFWQIVGATLIVGLVVGYKFRDQEFTSASDRAIARADSLQNAIADSTASFARQLHEDSLKAATERRDLVRAATSRQQAARAGQTATLLRDTLYLALPDTLKPVLARLDSAYRQETGGLREALGLQDSVIHDLNSRILWRDSVIRGVRNQLAAAMLQLRAALAAGRPRRCGLGVGAGYGVQSSGGQIRTGPSATAGISCRL